MSTMLENMGIEFKKKNPFKLLTQSEYERIQVEKFKKKAANEVVK